MSFAERYGRQIWGDVSSRSDGDDGQRNSIVNKEYHTASLCHEQSMRAQLLASSASRTSQYY
jgi:hypothetical protein